MAHPFFNRVAAEDPEVTVLRGRVAILERDVKVLCDLFESFVQHLPSDSDDGGIFDSSHLLKSSEFRGMLPQEVKLNSVFRGMLPQEVKLNSVFHGAAAAVAPLVRGGDDTMNQNKYKLALDQLKKVDLSGEDNLEPLHKLLTQGLVQGSYRGDYQDIIHESHRLTLSYPENPRLIEFCSKLWTDLDVSSLYVGDVKTLLQMAGITKAPGSFEALIRLNRVLDAFLKSSQTLGKSTLALLKQKLQGAWRTMVWLTKNVPTKREVQTFSNGLRVPYMRHANAVYFDATAGKEILDPTFGAMLQGLQQKGQFALYTSFLNNNEQLLENEFAGNTALKSGEAEHENLHVLFQSVDCQLSKQGQGEFELLFNEMLEAFRAGTGKSDENFVLPALILNNRHIDQYMGELEVIARELHGRLFDGKPELDNNEWRAFCLIFFAIQRDHMKLFLYEKTGQQCGHYTTPCKDFLDRGGINACVERMVHEAQLNTFESNKGQWLEDEMFSLIGATWATKKIGVLEDRLILGKCVYDLLEQRPDCLAGFSYNNGVQITEVRSYVREALNSEVT